MWGCTAIFCRSAAGFEGAESAVEFLADAAECDGLAAEDGVAEDTATEGERWVAWVECDEGADAAGLDGELLFKPKIEVDEVGGDGADDGIGVVRPGVNEGLADGVVAGVPIRGEEVFAGAEVVTAGVAGDLFLASGRDGALGFFGIGAVGSEFLFGHADKGHGFTSRMECSLGCQGFRVRGWGGFVCLQGDTGNFGCVTGVGVWARK